MALGFGPIGSAPLGSGSAIEQEPIPTVTGVAVAPDAPTIAGLAQQQFTATVSGTNSPSQAVTWSKVGGGTLSTSGLFTAPTSTSSAQTITITATSVLDGSKSGLAVVTVAAAVVTPPTVSGVGVSPATRLLAALASQQFVAVVSGTGSLSQQVEWSLAGGGSLSIGGLYVAPASTDAVQTATVTATSVSDGTKSGFATVTIAATPVTVPSGPVTSAPPGHGYRPRKSKKQIRPPAIQG